MQNTKPKHTTPPKMNIEILKSIAKGYSKKAGRKRLFSDEQLNAVRKLRSSGLSHTAIFHAMKDQGQMPYKTYMCYYTAYKNR